MRKSVDKNDPGYTLDSGAYSVFIDGFLNNDCITADEEQGMAIVYERNSDGELFIEGDEIKTKVVHGKVEIVKNERRI